MTRSRPPQSRAPSLRDLRAAGVRVLWVGLLDVHDGRAALRHTDSLPGHVSGVSPFHLDALTERRAALAPRVDRLGGDESATNVRQPM